MLLCLVLITLAAVFYIVATACREPNPASTGDDSGRGEKDDSSTGASKTAADTGSGGGVFGGFFSQDKRDKAIAKGVAAGAMTAGQAMFASDADSATAPKVADAKANMFSGGSLFPSTSKYGGYSNDRAEANPFLA